MLLVSNTASIANSDGPSGTGGKNVRISRRISTVPLTSINVRNGCGVATRLRRLDSCDGAGAGGGGAEGGDGGEDGGVDAVATIRENSPPTGTGMSRQSVRLLLA